MKKMMRLFLVLYLLISSIAIDTSRYIVNAMTESDATIGMTINPNPITSNSEVT